MRTAISDCKKTLNKKLHESMVNENFNNNWDQIIARVEKIEKTNIIEDFLANKRFTEKLIQKQQTTTGQKSLATS